MPILLAHEIAAVVLIHIKLQQLDAAHFEGKVMKYHH